MNRTVIPQVDLENVKPEDALKFWTEASSTAHPQHFKFQHVLSYPMVYSKATAASAAQNLPAIPATVALHNVTVRRKNITSKRLLDEICHQANLSWIIAGKVILVKPAVPSPDGQQ